MAEHEKFHYADAGNLQQDIQRLRLDIPFEADLVSLTEPLQIGGFQVPNRMSVLPMEGCDGLPDGKPGELTERRYLRFARGGAGTLWFEATAVAQEGRLIFQAHATVELGVDDHALYGGLLLFAGYIGHGGFEVVELD